MPQAHERDRQSQGVFIPEDLRRSTDSGEYATDEHGNPTLTPEDMAFVEYTDPKELLHDILLVLPEYPPLNPISSELQRDIPYGSGQGEYLYTGREDESVVGTLRVLTDARSLPKYPTGEGAAIDAPRVPTVRDITALALTLARMHPAQLPSISHYFNQMSSNHYSHVLNDADKTWFSANASVITELLSGAIIDYFCDSVCSPKYHRLAYDEGFDRVLKVNLDRLNEVSLPPGQDMKEYAQVLRDCVVSLGLEEQVMTAAQQTVPRIRFELAQMVLLGGMLDNTDAMVAVADILHRAQRANSSINNPEYNSTVADAAKKLNDSIKLRMKLDIAASEGPIRLGPNNLDIDFALTIAERSELLQGVLGYPPGTGDLSGIAISASMKDETAPEDPRIAAWNATVKHDATAKERQMLSYETAEAIRSVVRGNQGSYILAIKQLTEKYLGSPAKQYLQEKLHAYITPHSIATSILRGNIDPQDIFYYEHWLEHLDAISQDQEAATFYSIADVVSHLDGVPRPTKNDDASVITSIVGVLEKKYGAQVAGTLMECLAQNFAGQISSGRLPLDDFKTYAVMGQAAYDYASSAAPNSKTHISLDFTQIQRYARSAKNISSMLRALA